MLSQQKMARHYEDLIEGNEWETFLVQPLTTMKFEFERQLELERNRKCNFNY